MLCALLEVKRRLPVSVEAAPSHVFEICFSNQGFPWDVIFCQCCWYDTGHSGRQGNYTKAFI